MPSSDDTYARRAGLTFSAVIQLSIERSRRFKLNPILTAIMTTARIAQNDPEMLRNLDDDFIWYSGMFTQDDKPVSGDHWTEHCDSVHGTMKRILRGEYDRRLEDD